MARFLKALVVVTGARLFAVGDDWQAIYGFAGGDVDHIIHFESHFGPASTSTLNVNYRSPAVIVEAGAARIVRGQKAGSKQSVLGRPGEGGAGLHVQAADESAVRERSAPP